MASRIVKWHSRWWSTGLILPILATLVADKIEQVAFLTTLFNIAAWCKTAFIITINLKIAIWQLLIFLLIAIIFRSVSLFLRKKIVVESQTSAPFLDYKRGRLKKWMWSWNYNLNQYTKKYEITEMRPVCDFCDIKMLGDETSYSPPTQYKCPKCDRLKMDYTNDFESKSDIEALIIDNVEKGRISVS